MEIPGAGKVMPNNTDSMYYVALDGKSEGPFSLTELSQLIAEKKMKEKEKETYVWKPGMSQWDLAENVSEVQRLVALTNVTVNDGHASSQLIEGEADMTYCSSCGNKIESNAKFCPECGTPTAKSSTNNTSQHTQEYSGKIIKCPNCGEILQSFVRTCPTCGYELRGSNAADSVKEFEFRFNQAKTIGQKIDLIKTFAIPNTKEDVLEFIILAEANIDPDAYDSSNEQSVSASLSNAWLAKYEQAYKKAKMLFRNTPEFAEISETYGEKKKLINSAKKSGKKSKFFARNKSIFKGFGLIFLIFIPFIMLSLLYIPHKMEEMKLEKLSEQVEECIATGDYQTARIKANQIIDGANWSAERRKKWDNIRESLIKIIEENQAVAEGRILVGVNPSDLIGQDYKSVVRQLQKKGFTNIRDVADDGLITGWLHSDGEVKEVRIGGKTDFTEKSRYIFDVEIVVTYHTFSD
jgi:rRNA maturation endonuclease Nob1